MRTAPPAPLPLPPLPVASLRCEVNAKSELSASLHPSSESAPSVAPATDGSATPAAAGDAGVGAAAALAAGRALLLSGADDSASLLASRFAPRSVGTAGMGDEPPDREPRRGRMRALRRDAWLPSSCDDVASASSNRAVLADDVERCDDDGARLPLGRCRSSAIGVTARRRPEPEPDATPPATPYRGVVAASGVVGAVRIGVRATGVLRLRGRVLGPSCCCCCCCCCCSIENRS